jgi:hypothetical protein
MIFEIAAGVFIGNSISMGAIAGVNLWLERKTSKQKEALMVKLLKDAEAYEKTLVKPVKKTASPTRTVKP